MDWSRVRHLPRAPSCRSAWHFERRENIGKNDPLARGRPDRWAPGCAILTRAGRGAAGSWRPAPAAPRPPGATTVRDHEPPACFDRRETVVDGPDPERQAAHRIPWRRISPATPAPRRRPAHTAHPRTTQPAGTIPAPNDLPMPPPAEANPASSAPAAVRNRQCRAG